MIKILTAFIALLFVTACEQEKQTVFAPEYLHAEKGLQLITSVIDNRDSTISLIYGNELAVQYGRSVVSVHQPAEQYVMVTSLLRPMPQWYGTNMNGAIIRIEQVVTNQQATGGLSYAYTRQNAQGQALPDGPDKQARIGFIINQRTAVTP